jgi:hypothetical protein
LLQSQWYVMNKEKNALWLRQGEHVNGRLGHRYSVAVNQDIVTTIKL